MRETPWNPGQHNRNDRGHVCGWGGPSCLLSFPSLPRQKERVEEGGTPLIRANYNPPPGRQPALPASEAPAGSTLPSSNRPRVQHQTQHLLWG